ncbi:cupin domain-containing protein [Gordonia sp. TBRC 11910]|uniref:Cupin domain-containing protein n=1 Tax=Gordonia asplenii TaxID=2725283 RepID=A0A848L3K0_9ACTN|nr:cupin domain-containing protein [Gordonia asplenii]NMO05107.1 cupin domain-containing protein [Gordonia asplenii]
MSTLTKGRVHGGSADPTKHEWSPFEWEEPALGRTETQGEVTVFRPEGASGNLSAGFWRYHAGAPGARSDGSGTVVWSAPLGDESAVVIEGSAVITVTATGKQYEVGPGDIIHEPKGLEQTWEINGPYFKKFWVIWDSPTSTGASSDDLVIASINDNPEGWTPYDFTEPAEGDLTKGELIFQREGGSTGTLLSGLWRSGKGIAGSEADGTLTTPYTGVLGDETILLLEGEVHVHNDETGEDFDFKAGDVIGLTSGEHITWTSKSPFTKKFWVITNEAVSS